MRHTLVESCALDEEGYMHRRGGEEHERVSRGVLETEHGLQEREKEREKVRVGPGLRECEIGYKPNNC